MYGIDNKTNNLQIIITKNRAWPWERGQKRFLRPKIIWGIMIPKRHSAQCETE